MYAIDILTNSKKYQTAQEIYDNIYDIAYFMRDDIIKMKQKSGNVFFVNHFFDDFYAEAIKKNIVKLKKMKNELTKQFWDKKTTKYRLLKIIQSMLSSEISNGMDAARAGKPLVNVINNYKQDKFEMQINYQNDDLKAALDKIELERIDKNELIKGLKKLADEFIIHEDSLEIVKNFCQKFNINFREIIPDSSAKFCEMFENGEIKKDENNQLFFDFAGDIYGD